METKQGKYNYFERGCLSGLISRRFFRRPMVWLLLFSCFFANLDAQDVHFTQSYNNPLLVNPGLTGVFAGDARLGFQYRNQWNTADVDFQTYAISGETKIRMENQPMGYFALGLYMFHDQAGISQLTQINLGLSGSYTRALGNKIALTLGAQYAAAQRSFDMDDLLFDNNYVPGEGIDPSLPSGESGFNDTRWYSDFSAGLNFRYQKKSLAPPQPGDNLVNHLDQRTRLDAGVGVFHINRPDQRFEFSTRDATAALPIRLTPYIQTAIQLNDRLDLMAGAIYHWQDAYQQLLPNAGLRYHLSTKPGQQLSIQVMAVGRFDFDAFDAVSPAVEVNYNGWQAGFSYDFNTSEFNDATRGRAAPEIFLRYNLFSPPKFFQSCILI